MVRWHYYYYRKLLLFILLSNYMYKIKLVLVGFGCGMYYRYNVFGGFLVSLYGD